MVFPVLIGLFALFCMLFGFVALVYHFIRLATGGPTTTTNVTTSLLAACEHVDRLHRAARLEDAEYLAIRGQLEIDLRSVRLPPPARNPLRASKAPPQHGVDPPPLAAERPVPAVPAVPPLAAALHSGPPPATTPEYVVATLHTATPATTPDGGAAGERPRREIKPPAASWQADDPPRAPRRTWSELLQGFMEERNIRWGELISGLLIVGSAVGLVISLRDTLQDTIPYFPALLFMLLVGAVHAAGLYTWKRWDLKTTSQGALIIGMMLVPLGFLAACVLARQGELRPVTDPWYLLAVALGLAGYGVMTQASGRQLLPRSQWLTLGVLGPAASLLLLNRALAEDSPDWLSSLLSSIPLGCAAVGLVGHTLPSLPTSRWDRDRCEQFAILLGLTVFSLLTALGFAVSRAEEPLVGARAIATIVCLAGAILTGAGLTWRRRAEAPGLATWQTVGTAVGVLGLAVMASSFALAWPAPWRIVAVGGCGFVALGGVAILQRNSALLAAGLLFLGPAWIVLTHLLLGHYGDSQLDGHWQAAASGATGVSLGVLAAATVALGVWLHRKGDAAGAARLLQSAAAIVACSVVSAIGGGLWRGESWDAVVGASLLAFYGVAALTASTWAAPRLLVGTGAALLLASALHAACLPGPIATWLSQRAWLVSPNSNLVWRGAAACLAYSALAIAWSAVWRLRHARQTARGGSSSLQRIQWLDLSLYATSAATAALPLTLLPRHMPLATLASCLATAAAVWLITAWLHESRRGLFAAQIAAAAAAAILTADGTLRAEWWRHPLAAAHWHAQLTTLAVYCGLSALLFRWLEHLRLPDGESIDGRPQPAPWWLAAPRCDQILLGAVVVIGLCQAAAVCVPGWRAELGWADLAWSEWREPRGGWLVWLTAAGALAAASWRRLNGLAAAAFAALLISAGLRIAAGFADSVAVASATRWFTAVGAGAAATTAILVTSLPATRRLLGPWSGGSDRPSEAIAMPLALTANAVATAFVVILTTGAAWQIAAGRDLGGPLASTLWASMGDSVNFGAPLLLLSTAWLAVGVALRKERFALYSAVLIQYSATLGYCLLRAPVDWSAADTVRLLQSNLIAAGVWSGIWLLSTRRDSAEQPDSCRRAYLAFLALLPALLAGRVLAQIFLSPGQPDLAVYTIGAWPSYLGLLLAAAVAGMDLWRRRPQQLALAAGGAGLCLTGLIAASVHAGDAQLQWRAFHMLLSGMSAGAAALAAAVWLPPQQRAALGLTRRSEASWIAGSAVLAGLATLLGIRGAPFDPTGWVWSIASAAALTLTLASLAFRTGRLRLAYAGLIELGLACCYATGQWEGTWSSCGWLMLSSGGLFGLLWRLAHRAAAPRANWPERGKLSWQIAQGASWTLAFFALVGQLGADLGPPAWAPLAVLLTLSLGLACLWEPSVSRRAEPLFLTLVGGAWTLLALAVDWLSDATSPIAELVRREQFTSGAGHVLAWLLTTSVCLAAAAALWRRRDAWDAQLRRWGSPSSAGFPAAQWLAPVILFGACGMSLVAVGQTLELDIRAQRFLAAFVPLCGGAAVAAIATAGRGAVWHQAAIGLACLSAVAISFADLEPSHDAVWLERLVRLLTMLTLTAAALAWQTRQSGLSSRWAEAVRTALPAYFTLSLAAFLALLAVEFARFEAPGGAGLTVVQAVSVVVFVALLIAGLLAAAIHPQQDPLGLSLKRRMLYTYAAEGVAGLLAAHVYLSMPWLFQEAWREYWPYGVMALAFLGAGGGELLLRSQLSVLGEPLLRTSFLLPLLPMAGLLTVGGDQSLTLIVALAGLLFLIGAVLRQSFWLALTSALLGNAALWSLYVETGSLPFLAHPQFWLIPPAVSVLAAGHWNRRRLSAPQMKALRYTCISIIYLSSTSEVFLNGIGERLWPPMILALLSVCGVFCGILFRIRAFLYFGATFLFFSVVAMVSRAGQAWEHVWPWWAFGISLGVGILVMFGVFEKKRDEMNRLLEQVRQWD